MTSFTDRQWRRARRYIDENQAAPARAVLESILARDPDDTAAHVILGGLYAADDHQRAARAQALAAAHCPPDDPGLLGELTTALLSVGEVVVARQLLDMPAITASESVHVLMRAAGQRQLIGEHAAALALVERAREQGANGREFHFQTAVQLAFNGKMELARAELERCIAFDPPLGRAFVQLARMRKQTVESTHLDLIDAALARVDPSSEDCAALEFARYKELEDLQRYDQAWQSLARGNALIHTRLPHEPLREVASFEHLIQTWAPDSLRTQPVPTGNDTQPIFVIGMPRSGTTLLERILGNHSLVESASELGDFPRALAWATDHQASVMLDETTIARLDKVDWTELGQMYLTQTHWRAHGKPFFVDKLPRNWMLAGLIQRALPNAKILHMVRDSMDVCFSNWRAYFGLGPEFAYAYDLDALVAHFRQYRRVMSHWHQLAPGTILDVDYAQLVRKPEAGARRILDFCGLAWEPGCIDLSRNQSPVATLSVSQVRQPIHARSFEEWRPYAAQLDRLREALKTMK